jgi:hypothetical protein
MMVNAVVFGVGIVPVLLIPSLANKAFEAIPAPGLSRRACGPAIGALVHVDHLVRIILFLDRCTDRVAPLGTFGRGCSGAGPAVQVKAEVGFRKLLGPLMTPKQSLSDTQCILVRLHGSARIRMEGGIKRPRSATCRAVLPSSPARRRSPLRWERRPRSLEARRRQPFRWRNIAILRLRCHKPRSCHGESYFGGCNPGDVSHSFMREAVSACLALRISAPPWAGEPWLAP